MPRITEERRTAQRQRFLDAAWRCFGRTGVAGTTMEDIRAEAGMSTGAIYSYFASKDEVIRAVIDASLLDFERQVDELADSPDIDSVAEFVRGVLAGADRFAAGDDGVDRLRLAVQGWAHAQIDPLTAELVRGRYEHIRRRFEEVARRWNRPDDATPAETAELVSSVVLGYVTQRALGLQVDPDEHTRGLLAMAVGVAR